MRSLSNLLSKLPKRFQWTLHNIVAHPLSEVLGLCGYEDLADAVHDVTVPEQPKEEGQP